MSDSSTPRGCLPSSKQTFQDKEAVLHLGLMKAALETADMPLLGIAEPTISAKGTRRLHEANPHATDRADVVKRTVGEILLAHSDFVRAQRESAPDVPQIALPRLVQYDLFHIAEGMPETRQAASQDELHSFFFHQEAVDTLLDHCGYFVDRQVFVMLMWHTYSPVWDNWDFYRISKQMGVGGPIKLSNEVPNPFGMLIMESAMPRKEQQAIFRRVIDGFWLNGSTDSKALAFRQKLDYIADFAKQLALRKGSAIFRPYHEHSPDGFFWWALDNLDDDPAEAERLYRKLFHKTRSYLAAQGVDNLLYAYSPDIPYERAYTSKADFLADYRRGLPDLDQVEVLGIDAYLWQQFTPADQQDYADASAIPEGAAQTAAYQAILARPWERILQMIVWLREEYPDKIVGLTETGWNYEKWGALADQPITSFWQKVGLDRVLALPKALRPQFICFWRNDIDGHFHPYPDVVTDFSAEAAAIARVLETRIGEVV